MCDGGTMMSILVIFLNTSSRDLHRELHKPNHFIQETQASAAVRMPRLTWGQQSSRLPQESTRQSGLAEVIRLMKRDAS